MPFFLDAVRAKFSEVIALHGNCMHKSPEGMETYIFEKSRTKNEYLEYAARIILFVREQTTKSLIDQTKERLLVEQSGKSTAATAEESGMSQVVVVQTKGEESYLGEKPKNSAVSSISTNSTSEAGGDKETKEEEAAGPAGTQGPSGTKGPTTNERRTSAPVLDPKEFQKRRIPLYNALIGLPFRRTKFEANKESL